MLKQRILQRGIILQRQLLRTCALIQARSL